MIKGVPSQAAIDSYHANLVKAYPGRRPYYTWVGSRVGNTVLATNQVFGSYRINYSPTSAGYKSQIDAINARYMAAVLSALPKIRETDRYDDFSEYSQNLLVKGHAFPVFDLNAKDKYGIPFYTSIPSGGRGACPALYGQAMPDGTPGTTPDEDTTFNKLAKYMQDTNALTTTLAWVDGGFPEICNTGWPAGTAQFGPQSGKQISIYHRYNAEESVAAYNAYKAYLATLRKKYSRHYEWQQWVLSSPQVIQMNLQMSRIYALENNAEFSAWFKRVVFTAPDIFFKAIWDKQPSIIRGMASAFGYNGDQLGYWGTVTKVSELMKNAPYIIVGAVATIVTVGIAAPALAGALGVSDAAATAAVGAATTTGVNAAFGKGVSVGSAISGASGLAGETAGALSGDDSLGQAVTAGTQIAGTGQVSGSQVSTIANAAGAAIPEKGANSMDLGSFISNPLSSISETPLGDIVDSISQGNLSDAASAIAGQLGSLTPAQVATAAKTVASPPAPTATVPKPATPIATVKAAAVPAALILVLGALLVFGGK